MRRRYTFWNSHGGKSKCIHEINRLSKDNTEAGHRHHPLGQLEGRMGYVGEAVVGKHRSNSRISPPQPLVPAAVCPAVDALSPLLPATAQRATPRSPSASLLLLPILSTLPSAPRTSTGHAAPLHTKHPDPLTSFVVTVVEMDVLLHHWVCHAAIPEESHIGPELVLKTLECGDVEVLLANASADWPRTTSPTVDNDSSHRRVALDELRRHESEIMDVSDNVEDFEGSLELLLIGILNRGHTSTVSNAEIRNFRIQREGGRT